MPASNATVAQKTAGRGTQQRIRRPASLSIHALKRDAARSAVQCTAASALFSWSAGTAPGKRVPSARNTVGVPLTFIDWPSDRFLSIAAVSQVPAAVGALRCVIHDSHAFARSVEHQIDLAFAVESGDSTG